MFSPVLAAFLLLQTAGQPPPKGLSQVSQGRDLVFAQKWKEAQAVAEDVIARKDIDSNMRGEAEWILVQCFQGTGDWNKMAATCTRALQDKELTFRHKFFLHKVIAYHKLKDEKSAAETYAQAFDDAAKESNRGTRWYAVHSLISGLRFLSPPQTNDRTSLMQAAKELAKKGGPGAQMALGALAEDSGPMGSAMEPYEKARLTWKDDPILANATLMATIHARKLDRALALRTEVRTLVAAEQKNLKYMPDLLKPPDERFAEVCIYEKDPATATRFIRILIQEPEPLGSDNILECLLGFIGDEKLIEEVNGILVKSVKEPARRLQARWAASSAYAKIGKPDKAIAMMQDVTEANGWSKVDVDNAARWMAEYAKQPRKP